jgi:hypothetical protein
MTATTLYLLKNRSSRLLHGMILISMMIQNIVLDMSQISPRPDLSKCRSKRVEL